MPQLAAAISAIAALSQSEWELAAETLAQLLFSVDAVDLLLGLEESPRNGLSVDVALASWLAYRSFDVTNLLPSVTAPTLVLHNRGDRVVHFAYGVELAERIPNARFQLIDGDSHSVLRDATAPLAQAEIVGFLGAGAPDSTKPDGSQPSLTGPQLRVLRLLASGLSSREIANNLVLSERTVQRHITSLYTKLGVHNRVEAATIANTLLAR
jgi:DNA-binding CsgD family transcriptional regulator